MHHLFCVCAAVSRSKPQKGSLIFILTLVEGKIKTQQEEANTIKMPYLSALEERWMCGLPWGNEGLRLLWGFFLSWSVLSQPQEGLQIGFHCWVWLIEETQMAAI